MFIIKVHRFFKKTSSLKIKTSKKRLILITISIVSFPVFALTLFNLFYWGKTFPGISIDGVYIGGKTKEEAVHAINNQAVPLEQLSLKHDEQVFSIPLETISFTYDVNKSVDRAYYLFRTGNVLYDFSHHVKTLYSKTNVGLIYSIDEDMLNEHLSVIAGQLYQEALRPTIKVKSRQILFIPGEYGFEVDIDKLKLLIGQGLSGQTEYVIDIPISQTGIKLSNGQIETYKYRAENLLGKILNFTHDDYTLSLESDDLISLLNPTGNYNHKASIKLFETVASEVNRDTQNAVFVFRDGKVEEFIPAKNGKTLLKTKFIEKLNNSLTALERSDIQSYNITLPITSEEPSITTDSVNNMGIVGLVGKGTSTFRGSISSRIHNISLASSKFNGVLVKPGDSFSFNKILGDVSSYTGYKQAYVIKDGKTTLGDGGGVCQVSTTLFRAALDAGLPISERRSHSYRVQYYEQNSPPGLDATVYAPTTDLKIINNTPAHLLIQTIVDREKSSLVFEIYGTNDGRVSQISKPIVTGVTPPPEDLYVDDPTLPEGTIKQIDYKAWGARASVNYIVKRNDEVMFEKTFYSNYQPWQAIFLKGTSPIN